MPGIISYDDHDPYLVVAADKGTAQFSDIANSVATEYNYWLADAFASGGTKGYNHKQLGITARGAWESVKRHFRELGKDIQQQPFSVIGIGSMDGDVFGNGMLLSKHTQLLAAISGDHIFIDPQPKDNQNCFDERKRLFELPGSSWDDYNHHLISEGGGIFRRNDKNITVSDVLKKWLGIRYKNVDGETLIRYLLKAQVELLWLGGIGTYIKSSAETHNNVGDRINDSVRIDATELNTQVIGEGANLAFTQKARMEYALSGGRINTDAIDNSAGVDISDHEVNLKILLMRLYKKNKISDYQKLFNSLTEQVCQSVLTNNYKQTLCLSMEQLRSGMHLDAYMQLADKLEASNYLDRKAESFVQTKALMARQNKILTRPELAVLMVASKIYLSDQILKQSDFLKAKYFEHYLLAYFPEQISEIYKDEVLSHPLAREIKATYISNKIINQAGALFLQLPLEYENSLLNCCLCYLTFDQVIGADSLRQQVFELDNKIQTGQQYAMLQIIEKTLLGFCKWALINAKEIIPSEETIDCYLMYFMEYKSLFQKDLIKSDKYTAQIENYKQTGINQTLAEKISFIESIENFPFLVTLTVETKQTFPHVLLMHQDTNTYLGLDQVYSYLNKIQLQGYWDKKVCQELQNGIRHITGQIIKKRVKTGETSTEYFSSNTRKQKLLQYQTIQQKINTQTSPDLMPYIALKEALANLL
jgi:glutamate dehydrogenase